MGNASAWYPETYEAELTTEAEWIDTDASGHATFELDMDTLEVHYRLHIDFICDPTMAHIHLGEEGEDGPVAAWLYPEGGDEPEPIEGRYAGRSPRER